MRTTSTYTIESFTASPRETFGPEAYGSLLNVRMGSFETSDRPMISRDFCNCIAVIGLAKGMALFGHFQMIDDPIDGDYERFGAALDTLAAMGPDDVILAGCGLFDSPLSDAYAKADRTLAESSIRMTLPSASVLTRWNQDRDAPKDIVVSPEQRLITIHDSPWGDDYLDEAHR
jgi:hypothetical protein